VGGASLDIRIGTAGYYYRDWLGKFYPRRTQPRDMLAYYARHFPFVEINSSYYGIPRPHTLERMIEQVPSGFEFVLKAHQDMTHTKGELKPEVFEQFRDALKPLRKAKMLGGVLAQFPWSFRRNPDTERYLKTLRRELPRTPVVVEFRNSEWIDPAIFDRLRELDLGFCCVDEPRFSRLVPPVVEATSSLGYVRFHGRNAKKWEHHAKPDERYDYLYSTKELKEWIPRVEQLAEQTDRMYIAYNNHPDAKSVINAREMADLLNLKLPLQLEEEQPERLAAA
jgi:uncharacterized protein YecE (DUF72 family)